MSFYASPLFIDVLIGSIYVLLAVTVLLIVWSTVRGYRNTAAQKATDTKVRWYEGTPLVWGVAALLTGALLATYLLADTTPLLINGTVYSDTRWLRISDMLLNTSAILILVAVVCVCLGAANMGRRLKQ